MNSKIETVLDEMFSQRGYTFSKEMEENDRKVKIYTTMSENNIVKAYYSLFNKFNSECQKELVANKEDCNHMVIVYRTMTTNAKLNQTLNQISIEIELFSEEELMFNITKHELSPKYSKLEDAEEFKKKYDISLFPIMLKTDPIARFFNYKKNDIIEIVRKDNTVAYRVIK